MKKYVFLIKRGIKNEVVVMADNKNEAFNKVVVNVNIKMYKFLKIRMYKSVHFYFQLFPFFSFASINLSFNL